MKIRMLSVLFAAGVCLLITGCGKEKKNDIVRCIAESGTDQCAMTGEAYPAPLILKTLNSSGKPAGNIPLLLTVEKGSDLILEQRETVTDAGGVLALHVRAGKKTGDNLLRIALKNAPEDVVTVRFVSGVKLAGAEQEGSASSILPEPVGIQVADKSGKPVSGLEVTLSSDPLSGNKTVIRQRELVTGSDGKAASLVKLGNKTGIGSINIDIRGAGLDSPVRTLRVRTLSLNLVKLILGIAGGMVLFIFGMKQMSDGLTQVAGARMRSILQACSSNRVVAVLAGTLVTAVIHSGATTVMAIGFVNAGLLTLEQSIGIIFGANIGTTILAQVIAFDTSLMAMPALIAGLILYFLPSPAAKGWGRTILGFGFLFFGMGIMNTELKAIGSFPSFIAFFRNFRCAPVDGFMPILPVLGTLLTGMIATALIQSSTAVTGITIALGTGGLVDLYTAVVLILGSNIGTTLTAVIASIPANRVAKQTAMAHMLFNLFGVIIVMATFPFKWNGVPVFFKVVSCMAEGDVFAAIPQNLPRHIANAHLLFNVVTTLLLLPFLNQFAWLCRKIIPTGSGKVHYELLEPHLLDQPALALEQTVAVLRKMVGKSWKMLDRAILSCFIPVELDEQQLKKIQKRENKVDQYQHDIMDYLSLVMRRKLNRRQTEMIPPLMHCANDAERMADRAANIIDLTRRMQEAGTKLSDAAKGELTNIFKALEQQSNAVKATLESSSEQAASDASQCEKTIAGLAAQSELNHIHRLKDNRCTPETGIIYVELLGEILAISRHLCNISDRAIRYHFLEK